MPLRLRINAACVHAPYMQPPWHTLPDTAAGKTRLAHILYTGAVTLDEYSQQGRTGHAQAQHSGHERPEHGHPASQKPGQEILLLPTNTLFNELTPFL